MRFFKNNEKTLVKSLIYGFIGGFFTGVLFLPKEKLVPGMYGQQVYQATPFEYIMSLLKISVVISLVVLVLTIISLYFKSKKDESIS